jgi:phage-related protein
VGSPGGREIARLSVRVLPDTSGLGEKLRAELDRIEQSEKLMIPVDFDVKAEELRARLDALHERVTVQVDFNQPTLPPKFNVGADTTPAKAEVDKEVAEINAKKATVNVDVKFDKNLIQQRIETANLKAKLDLDVAEFEAKVKAAALAASHIATVHANVDVDRRSLGTFASDILSGIEGVVSKVGSVLSPIGGFFSAIGARATSVFSSVGDQAAGAFKGVLGVVQSLGPIFAQVMAYSAAFAAIGAAISAAWFTVAAAIAAVPAAISLLGVPIAAVALGMDGIKKAAQTLAPEFAKLKAAVSGAFQTGLTPVFQELKSIMPVLQSGLVGTAQALSAVAKGVADFITSAQGVSLIKTLFDNVNQAVRDMQPGIIGLTQGFLQLAGNQAALQALSGTINKLGTDFAAMVQRLSATGTLDTAFRGLQQVLASLSDAFIMLVDKGIQGFATAAPGIAQFVSALTGLFQRFDFARLGQAVGDFFSGFASGIASIPQATIDSITQAFQDLGAAVKSTATQQAIANLVGVLPSLIGLATLFVQITARMINGIAGLVNFLNQGDDAINQLNDGFAAFISSIPSQFMEGLRQIGAGIATFASSFAGHFVEGLGQIGTFFAGLWATIWTGLVTFWTTADAFVASAIASFVAHFTEGLGQIGTFFTTLWTTIWAGLTTFWTSVDAAIATALTTIATTIQTWAANIAAFFVTAWTGLTTIVQTAWTLITTIVTTAITTVVAAVQGWGVAMIAAVQAAWDGLTGIVTVAWAAITGAISTGVSTALSVIQGWGAQIVAFLQSTSAVQSAWQNIVSAVQSGASQVMSVISALPGQAISALQALVSGFADVGRNAVQALASAIASGASAVISAAISVARAAISAAKSALGIGSPSKEFLALGRFTWMGFIDGTNAMRQNVISAVRAITSAVSAEGTRMSDALNVTSSLPQGLGKLNGAALASVAPSQLAGQATAAASTVINTVINNPQPEKGSDAMQRRLRTLSALGLLGAPVQGAAA